MANKIYLMYKIYTDKEMNYEFGSEWREEDRKQLYAWTASKKYLNVFRQTHKEKKFIYENIPVDDDFMTDEFYKRYADKELHEVKLRYDYRNSPTEHIKVIMTDNEESMIDDEWANMEIELFSDRSEIPTLKIFKEKYQRLFDLINLSYYWATIHYSDDDVAMVSESKDYCVGACGFDSPALVPNKFQLYVDLFDPVLKGGDKD